MRNHYSTVGLDEKLLPCRAFLRRCVVVLDARLRSSATSRRVQEPLRREGIRKFGAIRAPACEVAKRDGPVI